MKTAKNKCGQKTVGAIAIISLALAVLPQAPPASAQESETAETVPGANCRQVISPELEVRQEPGGDVVMTLAENEQIYIANEGRSGWVPIEEPTSGFVLSSELGYCNQQKVSQGEIPMVNPEGTTEVSMPPIGTSCRQVDAASGTLNVRDSPDGEVIGSVEDDRYVYITNEGRQGWVPITKPMNGYVRADYLTYCP